MLAVAALGCREVGLSQRGPRRGRGGRPDPSLADDRIRLLKQNDRFVDPAGSDETLAEEPRAVRDREVIRNEPRELGFLATPTVGKNMLALSNVVAVPRNARTGGRGAATGQYVAVMPSDKNEMKAIGIIHNPPSLKKLMIFDIVRILFGSRSRSASR